MLIGNPKGLTANEADKILRPLAENSGKPADLRGATAVVGDLFKEHPDLLAETGKLLDVAQS